MFDNLKHYWQVIKTNIFDLVPVTFYVEVDTSWSNGINASLSEFNSVFNIFAKHSELFSNLHKVNDNEEIILEEKWLNIDLDFIGVNSGGLEMMNKNYYNYPSGNSTLYSKVQMPLSHYTGSNFWILIQIKYFN